MNRTYRVKWEIDIEASDFEDAARQALAIQRDPNSIATVFDCSYKDNVGAGCMRVDLNPEES